MATIRENENFKSCKLYPNEISVKEIISQKETAHLSKEREERMALAWKLNREYIGKGKNKEFRQAEIDKVFIVDKGHKDGVELHCVSSKGIIFILNESKWWNSKNAFITALIGRPNQIKRLYDEAGIAVSDEILELAKRNQAAGYNK